MSHSTLALHITTALIALGLAACGGGGGSAPAQTSSGSASASASAAPAEKTPAAQALSKSDTDIAALVYSGQSRVPADFYSEQRAPSSKAVATVHLKNRDVLETSASTRFELCTDDWNEALAWSELAPSHTARRADLVETNANERFYEFVREDLAAPDAPTVRQRVYRCAYLDRDQVDLDSLEGPGGRLHQLPVQAAALRQLGEYLWQFTRFNNFGNLVLSSNTSESGSSVSHELRMATLVRDGVSAGCDRIDIVSWTHTADRATGAITRTFHILREFGAREIAGGAEPCAS